MCSELHCLPNEGGLFQQDPHDVVRLERTLAARNQYTQDDMENKSKRTQATDRLAHDGT